MRTHLSNLIDDHGAILAFEFGIFCAMGQELQDVEHEVAKAVRDAARRKNQNTLLVPERRLCIRTSNHQTHIHKYASACHVETQRANLWLVLSLHSSYF